MSDDAGKKLSPEAELLVRKHVESRILVMAGFFGIANIVAVAAGLLYLFVFLPSQVATQAVERMSAVQELVNLMAKASSDKVTILNEQINQLDKEFAEAKKTLEVDLANAKQKLNETAEKLREAEGALVDTEKKVESLKSDVKHSEQELNEKIEEAKQVKIDTQSLGRELDKMQLTLNQFSDDKTRKAWEQFAKSVNDSKDTVDLLAKLKSQDEQIQTLKENMAGMNAWKDAAVLGWEFKDKINVRDKDNTPMMYYNGNWFVPTDPKENTTENFKQLFKGSEAGVGNGIALPGSGSP